MSDLRFLQELGAEFSRLADKSSAGTTRRRRSRWLRMRQHAAAAAVVGISLLIVVGVAAALLATRARGPTGSAGKGRGTEIVFRASVLDPGVVLGAAIERSMPVLRLRFDSVFPGVEVSRSGSDVVVRGVPRGSRARILALAAPAFLRFYDWEANVLLPDGRTVASLGPNLANNATARAISQGAGDPGAGSMSLYEAVELASRQPAQLSADNARLGAQYYMFARPGANACTIAGKHFGYTPRPGQHCLLSGPAPTLQALYRDLPSGINRSRGQVLTVPQGTVVLQAVASSFSAAPKLWNPSARFYVLEDHAALYGPQLTSPHRSTDQSGAPDVAFGFTRNGAAEFQKLTARLARRGARASGLGPPTLNQHFAVVLDQRLVTIPQIDFETYPNGILGTHGADITGSFTRQSAQTLAILLRYGPLTVSLATH